MFINVHEYHTYDLQQHQKTTIQTIFSRTHSPSTCPVRHALRELLYDHGHDGPLKYCRRAKMTAPLPPQHPVFPLNEKLYLSTLHTTKNFG